LNFLNLERQGATKIHEDNSACVAISTKPVHKSRSKHIGVKYHNVREACMNGEVELVQVWTEHQIADIFTKSLTKADFIRCRETLMGYVPYDDMVSQHPKSVKSITKALKLTYSDNIAATKLDHDSEPEVRWPKKVVSAEIDWATCAPGCMSWKDSIMGRRSYDVPGYGSVAVAC